jgi:hypothetical protein
MSEWKNIESKVKELESKWMKDLKEDIVHAGHEGKGALIKSIHIKVKDGQKGPQITIQADDYIKYLDNGNFLKRFLEKKEKELIKIIDDNIGKDILDQLTDIFE